MIRIIQDDKTSGEAPVHLADLVESTFRRDGWVQEALNLEYRPQQEAMAIRVIQAMLADEPLLFEAGTGVGKSLAYLIPGLLMAVETGRPFLVSTHTIALQEQILNKDLPLCRRFFQEVEALAPFRDFKMALLLGKANYLCETRLARVLQAHQPELIDSEESAELERIRVWATRTTTGLRHELTPAPSPEVWDQVNADSSSCNRKNCGETGCSYRRARRELMAAHVRILNHSLLFSLLNAGMAPGGKARGILFPEDFVVLDEAHTLPGIATEHFGMGVSSYAVEFALNRLYNPERNKGFLTLWKDAEARNLVVRAREASDEFFGGIRQQYLSRKEILRLREPGWARPLLQLPLKKLMDRLGLLESRAENDQQLEEIRDHRLRLTSLYEGIDQALHLAEEEHVYWIERSGKRRLTTWLRSAPIDVAPLLRSALFERRTAVVLTSATLSLGDDMENFRSKSGGDGLAFSIEASPFDFPNVMEIFVGRDPPTPNTADQRHQIDIPLLCDYLLAFLRRQEGGALVLFTSYRELLAASERLREPLAGDGRPLLSQGRGLSRSHLVSEFKQSGNAVLLGTDSFWTGVDIPGGALSLLVIPRLPFENPTHPVAEAKSEWLRLRGYSPFRELTLPDALIKFRQGIGRLIRNQRDRGRVLLLDPRLLHKEYGRNFLGVLPHARYKQISVEEVSSLNWLSSP